MEKKRGRKPLNTKEYQRLSEESNKKKPIKKVEKELLEIIVGKMVSCVALTVSQRM